LKTNLAGSRVVVRTEAGAYIGGTLWAWSKAGALFVTKEEICLNADLAAVASEWEQIPREAWTGLGVVVDDPRDGQTP
jgi:hypothetical protein